MDGWKQRLAGWHRYNTRSDVDDGRKPEVCSKGEIDRYGGEIKSESVFFLRKDKSIDKAVPQTYGRTGDLTKTIFRCWIIAMLYMVQRHPHASI